MSKKKQLDMLCYNSAGEMRFSHTEDTVADERDTHILGRKPPYLWDVTMQNLLKSH